MVERCKIYFTPFVRVSFPKVFNVARCHWRCYEKNVDILKNLFMSLNSNESIYCRICVYYIRTKRDR